MNLKSLTIEELREKVFSLQDIVEKELAAEQNVDKFLDQTNLFGEWEAIIPEAEFPIFIMAILNNIRREVIIETILRAILKEPKPSVKPKSKETRQPDKMSDYGKHPFN